METLYEKDKVWKISWFPNEDGTYSIKTEHGKCNGKMVEHIILVQEGKNKGKKNETTVEQQAIKMAQSDWNKKVRQGYSTTGQSTPVLKPMLALEYTGKVKYPVWVQPKLDGVRCLVYMNKGEVVFQSRQNTVYQPFEHLVEEAKGLLQKMPANTILDGELYTHGMGFEKIVSMVRRSKNRTVELRYTLYDFFIQGNNTLTYEERLGMLSKAYSHENHTMIDLIETQRVQAVEELTPWLTYYVEKQYEGIMLRTDGLYKEGRSKDLLKYKLFKDAEFEVVGHHMSKVGDPVPIFECTCNGKLFSVMMKENHEDKIKRMENIQTFYGKKLTVKYQELTSDGIPRFPVGIEFRDYD
jgi:ATP-dependent DNA ligase